MSRPETPAETPGASWILLCPDDVGSPDRKRSFALLYVRHRFDGTITHTIASPLTRALYGRRVRQPIGGDFGLSRYLVRIFLESPIWDDQISRFGVDIWMTPLAMNHRIPTCQSFMGRPKVHKTKDPAVDPGPMFHQVVGTIFFLMTHYAERWTQFTWSRPTAIFGFGLGQRRRLLSCVNKVEAMPTQRAEEYVEDQCLIFEETKPYLIQRWKDGCKERKSRRERG